MGLVLLIEAVYVFFLRSGAAMGTAVAGDETFGAPIKIGEALFTTYLLPFEITSVILLAALIGVVVLHQPATRSKQ
jgi:NADH-quinone oxidoreductase subunit J